MPNARIRKDRDWLNGVPVLASEYKALDDASVAAVDGDGGGSYTLGGAVIIGGAGMGLGGPWHLSGAAVARTPSGSGVRLVLGDNDYPMLANGHSGRTRNIWTHISELQDTTPGGGGWRQDSGGTTGIISSNKPSRAAIPLRVHNGAELLSVSFYFHVVTHVSVPANLPMFRVSKVDKTGTLTPLSSFNPANGIGHDGWSTIVNPGSVTVWNNGGNTQNWTHGIDAGTIIDTSKYSYVAEIVDESGAGSLSGTRWDGVMATHDKVADLRPG